MDSSLMVQIPTQEYLGLLAEVKQAREVAEALKTAEIFPHEADKRLVSENNEWVVQGVFEVDDIQGCIWESDSKHNSLHSALSSLLGKENGK